MPNRYIIIHDDRMPYPIKEYVVPVTESGNYVKTIEQVCEMLYHIDELLEDRAKSAAELHGDEMDDYSSIPT